MSKFSEVILTNKDACFNEMIVITTSYSYPYNPFKKIIKVTALQFFSTLVKKTIGDFSTVLLKYYNKESKN
jgi:hypothetical protein